MTTDRGRGRRPRSADPTSLLASLRLAFVLLIAVSTALMAVTTGAALTTVALAGVVGLVVGVVVVAVAFPAATDRGG